ncbi:MAG: hypothetical protein Q8P82_03030, partial [bacterium]|nr:hypothetical protein [bacterium]
MHRLLFFFPKKIQRGVAQTISERATPEPDAGRAQVTCEHGRRSAEAANARSPKNLIPPASHLDFSKKNRYDAEANRVPSSSPV